VGQSERLNTGSEMAGLADSCCLYIHIAAGHERTGDSCRRHAFLDVPLFVYESHAAHQFLALVTRAGICRVTAYELKPPVIRLGVIDRRPLLRYVCQIFFYLQILF
jgi:hypothetical protein